MENTTLRFHTSTGGLPEPRGERIFLMTRHDFGFRVRKLSHAHHWTQANLTSQLGYSEVMVSSIENGQRSPSFEQILKLADVFGVAPGKLFNKEGCT